MSQLRFDFDINAAQKVGEATGHEEHGARARGRTAFYRGLSAESCVERHYAELGARCVARRWRCRAGEIDLITQGSEGLIFVEVKAARTHDIGLMRLSRQQIRRIERAALSYCGCSGGGLTQAMRIDLAVVDQHGRVMVVENISGDW